MIIVRKECQRNKDSNITKLTPLTTISYVEKKDEGSKRCAGHLHELDIISRRGTQMSVASEGITRGGLIDSQARSLSEKTLMWNQVGPYLESRLH